jgi:hypothetical protein
MLNDKTLMELETKVFNAFRKHCSHVDLALISDKIVSPESIGNNIGALKQMIFALNAQMTVIRGMATFLVEKLSEDDKKLLEDKLIEVTNELVKELTSKVEANQKKIHLPSNGRLHITEN